MLDHIVYIGSRKNIWHIANSHYFFKCLHAYKLWNLSRWRLSHRKHYHRFSKLQTRIASFDETKSCENFLVNGYGIVWALMGIISLQAEYFFLFGENWIKLNNDKITFTLKKLSLFTDCISLPVGIIYTPVVREAACTYGKIADIK